MRAIAQPSHYFLTHMSPAYRRKLFVEGWPGPTSRVHSNYERTVADLPWQGVQLRLRLRRFCHGNRRCKRAIFCTRPLQGAVQSSQQLR